jgi:sugar phosphate isomerase/epimerase
VKETVVVAKTRTGQLGIGFRRVRHQQDVGAMVAWAKENGFECVDVAGGDAEAVSQVAAGMPVGAADLPAGRGMISPDKGKRREAVAAQQQFVRRCAEATRNFFVVMLPEDPARKRRDNFADMVDSYAELMPVLAEHDARLVVEGWPGPGALCCTPEAYRAFLKEMDSPAAAINYDPSHLLRMGIDPLRFLREFGDRVGHVHGKDTELLSEGLYEFGHEQPPTFAPTPAFGAASWRYCIPGHGQVRWGEALRLLAAAGYRGYVSVELEDGDFNGSEAGEKLGLVLARQYLEGC